mgnify:CR=1 FL=1
MITNIQLQVLPEVAANAELLLKVVSEKTNTKKINIKHIEIIKRSIDARQKITKINLRLDVYIDEKSEQIKVVHMCCAQDVGMAINPDQLGAQIESNLTWSVGMALLERFELGENEILSSNFDNYFIPRMSDMPSVDIEIIDQAHIPPTGAGELALVAGPPAIANAIRDACGFRALQLPIAFADIAEGLNN